MYKKAMKGAVMVRTNPRSEYNTMNVVQKTGAETVKKNNWEEKRALYPPAIAKEASSNTTLLRENKWQSSLDDKMHGQLRI
jgi:hypothetical protein